MSYHQSVLLHESIEALKIQPKGNYLDATYGGGGHSKLILENLKEGKLMAFDQDADVQSELTQHDQLEFVSENFRFAAKFAKLYNMLPIDGVLADLGVSSHQFDTPERGFSIRFDADLDMRMDHRNKKTAADVINTYDEQSLHKLFEQYGQVTNAKSLARLIVESRQMKSIRSIDEFKYIIDHLIKGNPNKYLAKVFQALRIEVNDELAALQEFLESIIPCLAVNGRICMITFHSLEDQIVKKVFKKFTAGQFELTAEEQLTGRVVDRPVAEVELKIMKAVLPSNEEIKENSRSRSAKLRIAERIK